LKQNRADKISLLFNPNYEIELCNEIWM